MRVLLVKLSSLGDVVHTLPAAMDLMRARPQAHIDWVVEPAFASLVRLCPAVDRVIEMDLRRWRSAPWAASTRAAWRAFQADLQQEPYDWVIDLQGLTKSALVSRLARLTPSGVRIAMANRTEGSSYEAPTRWVAHRGVRVPPHIHAVERARVVCAQALGYDLSDEGPLGLSVQAQQPPSNEVVCVHGTSREDKRWPEAHWLALGRQLLQQGQVPVFVHGSADELARSHRLASALPGSQVWPSLRLDELAQRMASTQGVIGVDSGVSHIAVALGLPHVQIYNFDTAWRTGPTHAAHQLSVFAQPCPTVQAVWQAWLQVKQQAPHPSQDQDQDREHTA